MKRDWKRERDPKRRGREKGSKIESRGRGGIK